MCLVSQLLQTCLRCLSKHAPVECLSTLNLLFLGFFKVLLHAYELSSKLCHIQILANKRKDCRGVPLKSKLNKTDAI